MPLDIPSESLRDIIAYCEHFNFEKVKSDIPTPLPSNNLEQVLTDPFEVRFITKYDIDGWINLINYSNFLDIPPIFELACAAIGAHFKGKNFD